MRRKTQDFGMGKSDVDTDLFDEYSQAESAFEGCRGDAGAQEEIFIGFVFESTF